MAEKKHYHDLIKSHKGDMKKSWAIIKNIINKHKKPRCQSKFKMSNGSVTDNKQIIYENFNDFFVNVGPTLAKCIPKIDMSSLEHMKNRVTESIYLNPVTHEEIKQILFSLCYVCYLKCLRELCILDYLHSWKLSKCCISTSMVSGGSILRIWLLWS